MLSETILLLNLCLWRLMESFSPVALHPQPWKIVMLRTYMYKYSSASVKFVLYGNVKQRDRGWENTHSCLILCLNGTKTSWGVCALGHHPPTASCSSRPSLPSCRGLPACSGPCGPEGAEATPVPHIPEPGAGPIFPGVLGVALVWVVGVRCRCVPEGMRQLARCGSAGVLLRSVIFYVGTFLQQ